MGKTLVSCFFLRHSVERTYFNIIEVDSINGQTFNDGHITATHKILYKITAITLLLPYVNKAHSI